MPWLMLLCSLSCLAKGHLLLWLTMVVVLCWMGVDSARERGGRSFFLALFSVAGSWGGQTYLDLLCFL